MDEYLRTLELSFAPYLLIVARFCLAAVFLFSGFDKLTHWKDSVQEVIDLGLPMPAVFVVLTIATQILGSALVIFNVWTAIGAGVLAAFTVLATLLGHRFWLSHGRRVVKELTTSLEHLAIVGGLLLLVVQSLAR
ncbi:DoxX family protein [Mesorhizobium sp.]|uniref:DoxX family protein n=1 Tax=Mesorhizobium sp. TaxID=1871066 RepID=UPI0025D3D369|nr:DoxX family protein [Mesorhizobium sp.]